MCVCVIVCSASMCQLVMQGKHKKSLKFSMFEKTREDGIKST